VSTRAASVSVPHFLAGGGIVGETGGVGGWPLRVNGALNLADLELNPADALCSGGGVTGSRACALTKIRCGSEQHMAKAHGHSERKLDFG
jgi:hypothetical protein